VWLDLKKCLIFLLDSWRIAASCSLVFMFRCWPGRGGSIPRRVKVLETALSIAEGISCPDSTVTGFYALLGGAYMEARRWGDAKSCVLKGILACEADTGRRLGRSRDVTVQRTQLRVLWGALATAEFMLGSFAEAARLFEKALADLDASVQGTVLAPEGMSFAWLTMLGRCYWLLGDIEKATQSLRRVPAREGARGEDWHTFMCLCFLTKREWREAAHSCEGLLELGATAYGKYILALSYWGVFTELPVDGLATKYMQLMIDLMEEGERSEKVQESIVYGSVANSFGVMCLEGKVADGAAFAFSRAKRAFHRAGEVEMEQLVDRHMGVVDVRERVVRLVCVPKGGVLVPDRLTLVIS